MKIAHLSGLLAVAVAFSAAAARADMVVGSGGFQSWTAADVNENGTPFWDNKSLDGPQANIGYQLMASSITPDYYGTNAGAAVASETFNRGTSAGAADGTLQLEISANSGSNAVGWYDTTAPSVLHQIWSGSDSSTSGADESFTPSESWGLYIVGYQGDIFYSQDSLDSSADNSQHFAIFQLSSAPGAEEYEIGVEDMSYLPTNYEGTGDFNDFVFTIQSEAGSIPDTGSPVPEPASLSVLGLGAAGLLMRRRKAKA